MTTRSEATLAARPLDFIVGRADPQHGVTLYQAHEVFSRFFERRQAVPTVAAEMGIEYKTACDILDGKIWPQARQHWLEIVLP